MIKQIFSWSVKIQINVTACDPSYPLKLKDLNFCSK